MSGKVTGLVWDHYPGDDQGERLTALLLADAADHFGRDVFLSAPRIAFFTGQSERTVRYQLKRMRASGFLIQDGSGLGGRGKTTLYHLDLQWLKQLPNRSEQWEGKRVQKMHPFENPAFSAPFDEQKPCKPATETLQKPCSLIADKPPNRGTIKNTTTPLTPLGGAGDAGGGGNFNFDELQEALAYQARTRGKPNPESWAAAGVRRCRKEGIGPGEKEAIQAWKRHVENQKKSEQQEAATRSPGKLLQPANWKAGLPENLRNALPPS